MPPLAHDNLDIGFGVRADPGGLTANAFRRPVRLEAVIGGHVVTMGGMLAIAGRALMCSHAFALKIIPLRCVR